MNNFFQQEPKLPKGMKPPEPESTPPRKTPARLSDINYISEVEAALKNTRGCSVDIEKKVVHEAEGQDTVIELVLTVTDEGGE